MKHLNIKETTELFHSYGLKCNSKTVKGWLDVGKLKSIETSNGYLISEEDAYDFLYDYRWDGTAYERGIDDQTRIERLEMTIRELKEENHKLFEKILDLEMKLGIKSFD